MIITYKDWHGMLPYALNGYQTSIRTSRGVTPYSLIYRIEVVLPPRSGDTLFKNARKSWVKRIKIRYNTIWAIKIIQKWLWRVSFKT